jgi:MFS family permease
MRGFPDETMIATISVPIANSLNAFDSFSWITTTYLLGSTIAQAMSGHLTDIVGRRKGLAVCYFAFVLGTLFCGLSHNLSLFLAGRILQGMGGGAVSSITAFVETDLIPMQRRPLIEGIGNICYGVMMALGGVYGAGIDRLIGWKWAFLIQVPIMIIDGAVVFFVVKISDEKRIKHRDQHVDLLGILSLLGSLALLEFGLNNGSIGLGWSQPAVIAPLCVAGIAFIAFLRWELKHARNPVVPVKAIAGRSVGSIQLSAFLSTGAYTGCLFYVSLYLQILGLSSVESSLRLIPLALLFGISSIATGYVVQLTHRYWHLNIALGIVNAVAYGLMCTLHRGSPSWQPYLFLGLLGVGFGGSFVTNLIGVLVSIPDNIQAVVQSAQWAIRSLGIAVTLTTSSVLFQAISRTQIQQKLGDSDIVAQFGNSIALDTSTFYQSSFEVQQVVLESYGLAISGVFYYLLAQSILAVLVSVLIIDEKVKDD